ncbi:DNA adenine methylase (plasmid) [Xanthomonas translucens pv. undulosa]|uniref:DNA adenine methylase n=1 Tax=Xanthomonas campestris pv. translucens TaxID=343 RepID=UPI0019D6AF94|nr:DNA adenine methylase [Xanthomonas translucens]QSQ54810.1 DNA adenine methylase [Xanthomonas translucens pv. undulosa]
MRYPGGKGGAGVYQTIINNIPPHDIYIESHLGGGNILERKRPAVRSIGIDIDREVIQAWQQLGLDGLELHCGDAVAWLEGHAFTGREFVYVDPPYVMDSRRSGKLYRHEYDDADHVRLLDVLAGLPCAVMVSGYDSPIYASSPLATWRTIEFNAMTRGGIAIERLWMNYAEPDALHDLRYLGNNFRERERIKRKKARWQAKLAKLDPLERAAIMECLRELEAAAYVNSIAVLDSTSL